MSYMIIGVHGLANKPPRDVHTQDWIKAIKEGLERNFSFNPDNISLELAYWADVRHTTPLNSDNEPYIPTPPDELIKKYRGNWLDELKTHSFDIAGDAMKNTRAWFGQGPAGNAILNSKLSDLREYHNNPDVRITLRKIVKDAIKARKDKRITVIAHSMGSIIAYDAMRELGNEDITCNVQNFITIGSPLGLPIVAGYIRKEWKNLRTPSIVRKWINLADRRDPVAFDTHLNDDYEPNDAGVKIQDDLIINNYVDPQGKHKHHKIYGYLRCPEMSELIRGIM